MKCLGKVFLVFWVILFITDLQAQHCPYDGLYTIAINTGKAFKKGQPTAFYLVEKPSGRKDSCRFNPMVDTVRFFSEAELRNKLAADPNSTLSRYLPDQLEKDYNFLKGNRIVLLSMSQKDCMVPRGNEYDLLPRNFVVVYTFNGSATEVPVPAERIYSLCGTGGSWKRIKPIEIQLP
jgi:hypothetical protein